MWAIPVKPYFDPEFADLMFERDTQLGRRNRYCGTVSHEVAMMVMQGDSDSKARADQATGWFLDRGGIIEIRNEDGLSSRKMVTMEGDRPAPGKKVRRNDPCPCGTGKKFKICCGEA